MSASLFNRTMTRIFGSRNERLIKTYRKRVEAINAFEPEVRKMTDAQMKARTAELRQKMDDLESDEKRDAEALVILPEAFALMRESMDRNIGLRSALDPMNRFDPSILPAEAQAMLTDCLFKCHTEHEWRFVEIPVALYDALRAAVPADRPPYRARPFDVQLIGAMVLFEGKIAEMSTGEGKTFVAPLSCFLMGLTGRHCHVVTVNDYLVKRDASWVAPAFFALGMSVGYIQSFMDNQTRKNAYRCTVTYGTNSEFGFDYLRDNMKTTLDEQCQGSLDFAIIDEVDSILIDEARTPLIISGPAHDDAPKYRAADEVTRKLIVANRPWDEANKAVEAAKRRIKGAEGDLKNTTDAEKKAQLQKAIEQYKLDLPAAEEKLTKEVCMYEVELDRKSVHLTHEGIQKAQEFAGVGSFYVGNNMDWPHLLEQSLRAHVVYVRDKDYMVDGDEIVIIDEFTGRKMVGRQWSDGLHQSCEAKEKVKIKPETQTMATVTLQNFFKLYKRISGMTGTALTEADEFMKIYKLDVVKVPTNRPVVRIDQEDKIYMNEKAKWNAIVTQIKDLHEKGQPVLVGTTSVEKSERLSKMLMRSHGIEHEVLNAKNHEREAEIVAMAGHQYINKLGNTVGRVTIATNMAGRGTDIKLAPAVPEAGGLFVLGTERHESRRIDNQLRGRSGRQGDPGESRFYLSLEDELMKLFAGDFMLKMLQRLGMQEDEPIEHSMVSKSVERAQKKVEERNFGIRKNLLEYDEVRDVQRNYFYKRRQLIIEGHNLREMIFEIISEAVEDAVGQYLDSDYVPTVLSEWARVTFNAAIDPQDLRDTSYEVVERAMKDLAHEDAKSSISTSLDEFMDPDADPADWDYNGLSKWALDQFRVQVSPGQLRKMDRPRIHDTLIEAAMEKIDHTSCDPIQKFLVKNYSAMQLAEWANNKFDLKMKGEDLIGKKQDEAVAVILDLAHKQYSQREIEYPVEYALEVTLGGGGLENIYTSEQLANWVKAKFGATITGDEVRSLPVRELHARLVEISRIANENIEKEVDAALEKYPDAASLGTWVKNRFAEPADAETFAKDTLEQRRELLYEVGHAFLRRELTELERTVLLQIFDFTWKDHLYAMDQLRETIGLRGIAEKDPRIEYKKEGTNLFNAFLSSIRDKVTDMIFKVRLTQGFVMDNVYSKASEVAAPQQTYGVGGSMAAQTLRAEQAAESDSGPAREEPSGPAPVATIVNEGPKIGRNDACPCGSGKKYKQCCGK